jgi:hypothetical protein
MGSVVALDMGVVYMRVMVFDRKNGLQMDRECLEEGYF